MRNQKGDMVSHPDHYDKNDPMYEPYKVIDAWGCNFNIGSAIKYLARYKAKWNPIEDLEKAKQYIDFEIESLTSKKNNGEADAPECFTPRTQPSRFDECSSESIVDDIRDDEQDDDVQDDVQMVNNVIAALEDGASRRDVMRRILGMSNSEIEDVMKMNRQGDVDGVVHRIADKVLCHRRLHPRRGED